MYDRVPVDGGRKIQPFSGARVSLFFVLFYISWNVGLCWLQTLFIPMIGMAMRSWHLCPVLVLGRRSIKSSDIDREEDGRRGHFSSLLAFYQGSYHFIVSSCIIVTGPAGEWSGNAQFIPH